MLSIRLVANVEDSSPYTGVHILTNMKCNVVLEADCIGLSAW